MNGALFLYLDGHVLGEGASIAKISLLALVYILLPLRDLEFWG